MNPQPAHPDDPLVSDSVSDEDDYEGPSKSQRKRDMHALQSLGEELAALNSERLRSLDLPERLLEALLQLKTFRAHGAVRRQSQFIGKLMRDIDPEPLRAQLDVWNGTSRAAVGRAHLAEHWRDRLLESDAVFSELLDTFPSADIPQLRTLIRNARKEKGEQKPPRNFRELYRALLALIEAAAPAATPPGDQHDAAVRDGSFDE